MSHISSKDLIFVHLSIWKYGKNISGVCIITPEPIIFVWRWYLLQLILMMLLDNQWHLIGYLFVRMQQFPHISREPALTCSSPLLLLCLQLSGGCELTVVIHDFVASNGSSGELSVRRGQTVEVLERLHDKPDWCLVRTTDRSPAQEGIVPCSMLCIAHSRSSMEMEGLFNHKGRRITFQGLCFRQLGMPLNSCQTASWGSI